MRCPVLKTVWQVFFFKVTHLPTLWVTSSTPKYFFPPKKSKHTFHHKDISKRFITILFIKAKNKNKIKSEKAWGVHQRVDKHIVTSSRDRILLSNKDEQTATGQHAHVSAPSKLSTKDYLLCEVLKQARPIYHDRHQNMDCLGERAGNCQKRRKATLLGVEACFIVLAAVVTWGLLLSILLEVYSWDSLTIQDVDCALLSKSCWGGWLIAREVWF